MNGETKQIETNTMTPFIKFCLRKVISFKIHFDFPPPVNLIFMDSFKENKTNSNFINIQFIKFRGQNLLNSARGQDAICGLGYTKSFIHFLIKIEKHYSENKNSK